MAARATGADDGQYSSLPSFGTDDAKNSVRPGDRDEDNATRVRGVGKIDAMGIKKAEHRLSDHRTQSERRMQEPHRRAQYRRFAP
jgi:hypothetical protein